MSKIENLNPYLQVKQSTERDARNMGVLVSDRYEADSTASQTIINLSFTVTQTVEQKRGFQLYVNGNLLREGVANDYQFTAITGSVSSQVTLNAPIPAGLNIIALKVGGYQDPLPNASTVTASVNSTNLALDQKGNFNRVINGAMDFWQRGTSFAAIANAVYFADRWKYQKVGTTLTVATVARDTDVPATAFGVYSASHTITTASGAVAAGDNVVIQQFVEGNIFRTLKGKNIVCRFWVKSPKTGIHCISFSNSADNRCLIKEYNVTVANTWQQITIRFSHDTTGTWLYDTGIGMGVQFALLAGSTFQAPADVWQTTNVYATVNQVNVCDTIGNVFKVTDVMMVEDNTALNSLPNFVLAGRDFRDELSLCQRYYEKTYSPNTAPASITTVGALYSVCISAASGMWHTAAFEIMKRAIPVVTTYSPSNGSTGNIDIGATPTAVSTIQINEHTFAITGGAATNNAGIGHWTADADF